MTREQIEQWASQAGWRVDSYTNGKERRLVGLTPSSIEQVERFVELVAAHEREQCALVCDLMPAPDACNGVERSLWDVATMACCDAITARGEVTPSR